MQKVPRGSHCDSTVTFRFDSGKGERVCAKEVCMGGKKKINPKLSVLVRHLSNYSINL